MEIYKYLNCDPGFTRPPAVLSALHLEIYTKIFDVFSKTSPAAYKKHAAVRDLILQSVQSAVRATRVNIDEPDHLN